MHRIRARPPPSHVITTSMGQAAVAWCDARDNLVIQDHTWNRFLFYTTSSNAPVVQITNRIVTVRPAQRPSL
jgi:hypothetical protein